MPPDQCGQRGGRVKTNDRRLLWGALAGLALSIVAGAVNAAERPDPVKVLAVMRQVGDWQLAYPEAPRPPTGPRARSTPA